MYQLCERIKNTYYYAIESVRNRYPCKIIKVTFADEMTPAKIKYMAASKINIRETTTNDILDDPLLVEKFHPTDGVKLGFLAFGEIILNQNNSIEYAKEHFNEIAKILFKDVSHSQ